MIFDHIGLFVRDLASGNKRLAALFPIVRITDPIEDPLLKVRIQFAIDESGIRYELVAPFGEGNPVDGVLASGKNILNHVAYRVPAFDTAVARLESEGCVPLGPALPAVAFGGARVIFFYTPLKFIVELIDQTQ
jgi:methylmalonyl-CoA/ethylmalonyl-CoA epimerase